jgi:hypothetical protein
MKINAAGWMVRVITVLGLAAGTVALAQFPQRALFQGTLNDYTPAAAPVSGPWEVRGAWSLEVNGRTNKADFSAALTMERSDQGAIENAPPPPPGPPVPNPLDNPALRSAHTHHITLLNGKIARITNGFTVTGYATITKDGVFPPPFGSVLPLLTITITGGAPSGKGDVVFSNISVVFGPPGDKHFGMNPLNGVIRSVDPEGEFGRW